MSASGLDNTGFSRKQVRRQSKVECGLMPKEKDLQRGSPGVKVNEKLSNSP